MGGSCGAPGDDLGGAADALQRGGVAVGRPLDLDAVGAHQAASGETPAPGERERGAPRHDLVEDLGGRQAGAAREAEGGAEDAGLGGAEHAADHMFAAVGGEPAHPHALAGQPVPDREQQAGDQPEAGLRVRRQAVDLPLPQRAPLVPAGVPPLRGAEFGLSHGLAGGRADQPDAFLDPAVVEHARGRRQHQGGAPGAAVDHEPGLAAGGSRTEREGGLGGCGFEPVAAQDLDDLDLRAGALVDEHRLARGDGQGVGAYGLYAALEGAGLDGLLDVGLDAALQFGEQRVLLGDGERQQSVEELRHRRQILLEAALPGELEPGRVFEAADGPMLDTAAPQRDVKLPERRLGVKALQVVRRAEQRGVAAAPRLERVRRRHCPGRGRARDQGDEFEAYGWRRMPAAIPRQSR